MVTRTRLGVTFIRTLHLLFSITLYLVLVHIYIAFTLNKVTEIMCLFIGYLESLFRSANKSHEFPCTALTFWHRNITFKF
jgi:hypothetical protein